MTKKTGKAEFGPRVNHKAGEYKRRSSAVNPCVGV